MIRREELEGVLRAVLVIPLAAGAVYDRVAAELHRVLRRRRADQLARHARRAGVAVVIHIRADRLRQPLLELAARIEKAEIEADRLGTLAGAQQFVLALPNIDGDRDDFRRVIMLAEMPDIWSPSAQRAAVTGLRRDPPPIRRPSRLT